jgi:preprotein translocase subunit SecF
MRIFAKVPTIDFMAQRRRGLMVSAVLTTLSILLLIFHGLNFGIDFTGGLVVEATYPQSVQLDDIRGKLETGGYQHPVLQYFGTSSDVLIRLPAAAQASTAQTTQQIMQTLGVAESCPAGTAPITKACLTRIDFVGPEVGDELFVDGSMALFAAFAMIAAYIAFRFEWKFSLGAIAALVHDTIMVLGFLSLTQTEFDLTTLAAILALIGYSNNETIVIFDRVRENFVRLRRATVFETINLSVNQTLLRSIITHLTTLLVCTSLLLVGGPSVHGFAVTMIVGVIVATYSSIYISTGLSIVLGISREDLLPPKLDDDRGNNDGAVV